MTACACAAPVHGVCVGLNHVDHAESRGEEVEKEGGPLWRSNHAEEGKNVKCLPRCAAATDGQDER